jgi:hypothetical protein
MWLRGWYWMKGLMCRSNTFFGADDRFDWRIRVPRTLAAHDFHPEGRVTHTIFAVVEVITPSRSRPTTRPSSPRPSTSRQSSQSGGGALTPVESGAHTPPYEDTIEVIKGKRTCMVVHENPNEGVINLDLKGEGVTPGLGVYTQHYTSDIVRNSCPFMVVADSVVDDMRVVQLQAHFTGSNTQHYYLCYRPLTRADD